MRRIFSRISPEQGAEIDDAVLTITEKEAAKIEWPLHRRFLSMYWFVGMIALFILFGRVVYMGTVEGDEYREQARRNSLRQIALPAPRGIIYDVAGKPLVHNVPNVSLVFVPADGPKNDDEKFRLSESLRGAFDLSEEGLRVIRERSGEQTLLPFLLKEGISQEEVLTLYSRGKDFPGVGIVKEARREYVDGLIFSQVIGYEGKIGEHEFAEKRGEGYLPTDSIGKQGIERSYERDLRGVHGYERVEVDAFGRPQKTLGLVLPESGSDLFLNIDAELQKKAFDSLQAFLESRALSRGAVIAIDPRDGAVRALVSIPSYDNNLFAGGISAEEYRALIEDPSKPLFNRAIAGEYPPGSTFKPVVAAAALAERLISERTQIESRGGISVGSFFFGDWKAHGFTDVRRAIAVSSDVFFYSIGGGYGDIPGLGIRRIKEYASRFGYGEPTGIDLPGEADGLLPDPEWKEEQIGERWYIGDDYHASIGQGFITATPLQIVNSVAAIANGGTLYVPRVVSSVRSPDGKIITNAPKVIREHIVDPYILKIVREGMREAVTEGTAQPLSTLPYPVAGKTGTAQFGTGDLTHGWFVSFAPYDEPELAMIVLVEGQEKETYNAVPVTRDIYEWYFARKSEEKISEKPLE